MSKLRHFLKIGWAACSFLVDLFLDALMPMECGACSRLWPKRGLCQHCQQSLKSVGGNADVRVFYEYSGALKSALQRAKFNKDSLSVRALASLFEDALKGREDPAFKDLDLIVFVPSPFWRRTKRGFDLSAIFAQKAQRVLNIPLRDLLKPKARAPLSHSASADERALCVKGAFSLRQWDSVLGKRILLVDDVRTSGVTLKEITSVLLEGGAQSVFACCLAQTPQSV